MDVFDELKERGIIAQISNEPEIRDLINQGKATFYIGFDPTSDSLHVGHFMALCLMRRLQLVGNKPIVLIGGGTGMIGDPTGRTDLRQVLSIETINHNCDCFKGQMRKFIEFGDKPGQAIMLNNADWLMSLNYIGLLREVGACFSVNSMLRAECYRQRMERGLSFLEFNYMIMQAYDFYHLFQNFGCNLQFGGNDQWSNMIAGTELIRKKLGQDAHVMTINLLLNSEGKKMGKTANGAIWLDANKTSPYEFFQYWRNIEDTDVIKCLKMLTFIPLDEIRKMEEWNGSKLNQAKEILALELTTMVHGKEAAESSHRAVLSLFRNEKSVTDTDIVGGIPSKVLDLQSDTINIVDLFKESGLCPSKSEARRLIKQGGAYVNGIPVPGCNVNIGRRALEGVGLILKAGKKRFMQVFIA